MALPESEIDAVLNESDESQWNTRAILNDISAIPRTPEDVVDFLFPDYHPVIQYRDARMFSNYVHRLNLDNHIDCGCYDDDAVVEKVEISLKSWYQNPFYQWVGLKNSYLEISLSRSVDPEGTDARLKYILDDACNNLRMDLESHLNACRQGEVSQSRLEQQQLAIWYGRYVVGMLMCGETPLNHDTWLYMYEECGVTLGEGYGFPTPPKKVQVGYDFFTDTPQVDVCAPQIDMYGALTLAYEYRRSLLQ